MSENITVFVTKYALTVGIEEHKAEPCFDTDPNVVRVIGATFGYLHKGEWWRTREAAVKKACEMRAKKIASLQKQITKLSKLTF